eukprot:c8770_g1_i2.p1 GENE.c8770_g1_i2~~c8770_g1_i2.p1  ORF type:complete len:233 (+),score=62.76 c8770_g1_i2:392-1090(+)
MHSSHRMKGFLKYWRETIVIRKVPLIASGVGSATVTVVYLLTSKSLLTIEIVICAQSIITAVAMAVYIYITAKHNRKGPTPDTEESSRSSLVPPSPVLLAQQRRHQPHDLDMISFLLEQNSKLSQRVLALENEQGDEGKRESQHLLEAKAKDIRLLNAEKDQLFEKVQQLQRNENVLKQTIDKLNQTKLDLQRERDDVREEKTTLEVLLEVEKTANIEAQRLIRQLRTPDTN